MKTISITEQRGIGAIGIILLIPVVLVAALIAWIGFAEARKAYWDNEVRVMCAKDGGVRLFERVSISKSEVDLLKQNDKKISVPIKELAPSNAPVYSENTQTYINRLNPEVWRRETAIIRRSDQKVVARWISYSRVGGDSFTLHPSYFGCPESSVITTELEHLFIVEGESR